MASTSTSYTFTQNDIQTTGYSRNLELYRLSNLDIKDMPFGYSNGLGSLYTKVSLNTDFALSVDVNLGVSSAGVFYPVT
ncbi:MAG TPA: hypothetical protein PLW01_00980, partial [Agitococcus sp.]|nr:hypothetical protein [Agitococcus sp.]